MIRPNRLFLSIIVAAFFLALAADSRRIASEPAEARPLAGTHEHGGRQRPYLLYVPERLPPGPRPLLLALHGSGGSPESFLKMTGERFNEIAEEQGLLVLYPGGPVQGWESESGHARQMAGQNRSKDAEFLESLIDRIAAERPLDPQALFAAGFSSGGFLALRLGCEMNGRLRGVAAVAAVLTENIAGACPNGAPFRVLLINGLADTWVPYDGGTRVPQLFSTGRTLRFFAARNRCQPAGRIQLLPDALPDGTTVKEERLDCPSPGMTVLLTVSGGGHTWPGGEQWLPESQVGRTGRDIDAADVIADFFLKQGPYREVPILPGKQPEQARPAPPQ